jgi:hypothetical protein
VQARTGRDPADQADGLAPAGATHQTRLLPEQGTPQAPPTRDQPSSSLRARSRGGPAPRPASHAQPRPAAAGRGGPPLVAPVVEEQVRAVHGRLQRVAARVADVLC